MNNENLRVQSSAFPNGDYITYSDGMPKPRILPSNHPDVLKMRYQRAVNRYKPERTVTEQAQVIIDMTSAKLRRAK